MPPAKKDTPTSSKIRWKIITNVYINKNNSPKTPLAVSPFLIARIRTKLIWRGSSYSKNKSIFDKPNLQRKLNNYQANAHLQYTEINMWPTYFEMETKLCMGPPWIWFGLHHRNKYLPDVNWPPKYCNLPEGPWRKGGGSFWLFFEKRCGWRSGLSGEER